MTLDFNCASTSHRCNQSGQILRLGRSLVNHKAKLLAKALAIYTVS